MTRIFRFDAPPYSNGIGQRGEIETKRHTRETQVRIPWVLARHVAFVLSLIYLSIWAVVFLVWLGSSPPETFWDFFSVNWGWWAWFLPKLPYILIPIVPIWSIVFAYLSLVNYVPKMLNDNWPPPWAQANPLETGFFGAHNMPWRDPPDEQPKQKITIEGIVSNGSGDDVRTRFETEYPERWKRYLSALVADNRKLRPGFSVRTATSLFFRIPEGEFTKVSDQWIRIGYAKTTSNAPNAKRYLTAKGEAFARGWRDGNISVLLPETV